MHSVFWNDRTMSALHACSTIHRLFWTCTHTNARNVCIVRISNDYCRYHKFNSTPLYPVSEQFVNYIGRQIAQHRLRTSHMLGIRHQFLQFFTDLHTKYAIHILSSICMSTASCRIHWSIPQQSRETDLINGS